MNILKYVIVGVVCLILGIIIAIIAKNIFAGLGFAVLGLAVYILWNYFNSAQKDMPDVTADKESQSSSDAQVKDN